MESNSDYDLQLKLAAAKWPKMKMGTIVGLKKEKKEKERERERLKIKTLSDFNGFDRFFDSLYVFSSQTFLRSYYKFHSVII